MRLAGRVGSSPRRRARAGGGRRGVTWSRAPRSLAGSSVTWPVFGRRAERHRRGYAVAPPRSTTTLTCSPGLRASARPARRRRRPAIGLAVDRDDPVARAGGRRSAAGPPGTTAPTTRAGASGRRRRGDAEVARGRSCRRAEQLRHDLLDGVDRDREADAASWRRARTRSAS